MIKYAECVYFGITVRNQMLLVFCVLHKREKEMTGGENEANTNLIIMPTLARFGILCRYIMQLVKPDIFPICYFVSA